MTRLNFDYSQNYTGAHVSDFDFSDTRLLFGWLPVYPMLMLLGVLLVIGIAVINFRLRKIPLRELEILIVIVVPIGAVGASFFGKLNFLNPMAQWWKMFYFWEPGMSLFGGIITGGVAGFCFLYSRSKKTLISIWVYADCVLPQILLAQAIGRWGNLFNHEILGPVTTWENLSWLPDWIRNRLFYIVDKTGNISYDDMVIAYRQPLFLYESIADFAGFIFIMGVFPNLGKWFSTKPWKYEEFAFPTKWNSNKELRALEQNKITQWPIQENLPIKYIISKKTGLYSMSLNQVWNKAYYLKDVDTNLAREYDDQINKYCENYNSIKNQIKKIKTKTKLAIKKDKQKLNFVKNKQEALNKHKIFVKQQKLNCASQIRQLGKPSWISYIWNIDSSKLEYLHNPNKYFIIRCGSKTGMYVIWYMFVRIILEPMREPSEYFIQNFVIGDFVILGLLFIFGILLFISAQFIAPYKWRRGEWLYEKSY